jgi:hypothetical protein
MTTVPNRIIFTKADKLSIGEILSSYSHNVEGKTEKKYRKPPYQRHLSKPTPWCVDLIDSILIGYSTGALTLSRWTAHELGPNNSVISDEYFHVEDGQTRLDAYVRFQKGEFDSTYGPYTNKEIQRRFDTSMHAVIIQEKSSSRIHDTIYYTALMNNFSKLQEGTPLTSSDRYWAWKENSSIAIQGSPLVNYVIKLAKTSDNLKKIFKKITSKDRKNLATLVGLVSGCLYGPDYANSKYFDHAGHIQNNITDNEKVLCEKKLAIIFCIINRVEEIQPKYPNEKFSALFKTTQKFTGAIIFDMNRKPLSSITDNWVKFIVEFRQQKENGDSDWANKEVYQNLSTGNKRNNKTADFKARADAVYEWAQHN